MQVREGRKRIVRIIANDKTDAYRTSAKNVRNTFRHKGKQQNVSELEKKSEITQCNEQYKKKTYRPGENR